MFSRVEVTGLSSPTGQINIAKPVTGLSPCAVPTAPGPAHASHTHASALRPSMEYMLSTAFGLDPAFQAVQGLDRGCYMQPVPQPSCAAWSTRSNPCTSSSMLPTPVPGATCTASPRANVCCMWCNGAGLDTTHNTGLWAVCGALNRPPLLPAAPGQAHKQCIPCAGPLYCAVHKASPAPYAECTSTKAYCACGAQGQHEAHTASSLQAGNCSACSTRRSGHGLYVVPHPTPCVVCGMPSAGLCSTWGQGPVHVGGPVTQESNTAHRPYISHPCSRRKDTEVEAGKEKGNVSELPGSQEERKEEPRRCGA